MASRRSWNTKTEHFFDYNLLLIVIFLLGFGLIMIYSASSYTAFEDYDDAAYYLKKQALAVAIGFVIMGIAVYVPREWIKKMAPFFYVGSIATVFLVKTPLGITSHGATRWFRIPGIGMQLQPAEIVKVGMIISVAALSTKIAPKLYKRWQTFALYAVMALVPAAIIYAITSNLSSALIVVAIAGVMVFVADPDYLKYFIAIFLLIGAAFLIVYLAKSGALGGSFRVGRITAWLDPESDSSDTGYQILQGLYAIGSGGYMGKGLGESIQKLSFVPEAQNDMIFSIICEELGLFGAMAIIIMFIMLLWRMMVIANNADDQFSAMLVVGVLGHIAVQVVLNIAVVTNSIPNTGVSLPFISYGGSSVVFLMAEIGMVLGVSRGIAFQEAADGT